MKEICAKELQLLLKTVVSEVYFSFLRFWNECTAKCKVAYPKVIHIHIKFYHPIPPLALRRLTIAVLSFQNPM